MKFSWQDIVFDYCDIVIPVRATLLMIESQGMAYLMNDHTFLNNYRKIVLTIEGVRIKTRLSHIFMKNELRVFFIRKPDYAEKPDYASFGYVTIPLHSLVTSNLRHLDVVSAETGLS